MNSLRFALAATVALASLVGPAAAAPPTLYSQPFHQGPVRGEPDDLLLLAGHGFAAGDVVVYRLLGDTTLPLVTPASVPSASTADLGIADVVSDTAMPDAIVVRLPFVMKPGRSYALWVRNLAGEWSGGVRINDARPLWISPDKAYATASLANLPRELKVVGRNLQPLPGSTTRVRLVGPGTYPDLIAMDDGDPESAIERYVARVSLPASLQVGTYSVELSRDGGTSWVTLAGQGLEVQADPIAVPSFDVADPAYGGCIPDDNLNDAFCIQLAADAAAAAGGGKVHFGPGRWDLTAPLDQTGAGGVSHGILVHPHVSLIGSGTGATTVVRTAAWGTLPGFCDTDPCLRVVFTLQGHNTVTGIHFADEFPNKDYRNLYFQLGRLPWTTGPGDPTVIEEVIFTDNLFTDQHIAIHDGGFPLRRIYVTYNEFAAYLDSVIFGGNKNLKDILYAIEDTVVAFNDFYPGQYYAPEIGQGVIATQLGASRRVDFSGNVAHRKDYYDVCDTLPTGCGWRAGHFWHMAGSHENLLVSQNSVDCAGDKAGDGESIIWDNNGNDAGLAGMRDVLGATATSVTVPGPWIEDVIAHPDYYKDYWVQVVQGKGIGQVRPILGYSGDPSIQIDLELPWDVIPDATSKVTVTRQYWQTHIVDNVVDIRGCEKDNPTAPRSGRLGFYAMTADSAIEGNRMYESDGITLAAVYSKEEDGFQDQEMFQFFNEVRGNLLDGEYNFNDCLPETGSGAGYCPKQCCTFASCCPPDGVPCLDGDYCDTDSLCCSETTCCVPNRSWAGINLGYGQYPVADGATLGFGVTVAGNTVIASDALRGGGISIDRGWHGPPTPGHPQYRSTLIHHNELRDLERRDIGGVCLPYSPYIINGGVGVHVQEAYSHDVVIYANTYENVCYDVEEFGTNTVRAVAPGAGSVPPSLDLRLDAPDRIEFIWPSASCSGAADYAVYEGTLGDWTSHTALTCSADVDCDRRETLDVSTGDRYYMVVPLNPYGEGSYGQQSLPLVGAIERPVAAVGACATVQDLSCP